MMRNKPNELSTETKASMRTRIISAVVGTIIVVPILFLGDFFFFALMGVVTIIGTYEIVHCAKKKYNPALYIVAIIFALLLTYWPIIATLPSYFGNQAEISYTNWHLFGAFNRLYIAIAIVALGAFGLFFMVIIDKGFTVRDACFMFTMIFIVTVGLQSALYIRYLPSFKYHELFGYPESYFNLYDNLESALLLIYVLLGTFMTDIGAYFIGVFFGKHKMNPRISPKKTWEGFVGGIVISLVFSLGFALILSACKHPLVYGILDLEHWYFILALSFIIPLVSTLGDFVFSCAKRHFEIKDFGNLIPGHGGILDRIDSVIFSMITTAVFLETIQYWSSLIK
jgi:phosphatidate cytidylyltransferase